MKTDFQKALDTILAMPGQSQQRLAALTGVDVAHIHRLLRGTFTPSQEVIGRMVATLPPPLAALVMKSYLEDHVAGVGSVPRPKDNAGIWRTSKWRKPSDVLRVVIEVTLSSKK